jgi:glycyl-tRNA synthetase beta chain
MLDKTERIERLAGFLSEQLHPTVIPAKAGIQSIRLRAAALDSRFRGNDELGKLAQRVALLANADFSTGMVSEFPELQGVMGRHYAVNDGEDTRVADAIADHYKPLGPSDSCPTAPVSIIVALADKIDSLAGFFSIGEAPTGSRDPFALRRAALGIIRIVLENGLRLPILEVFVAAVLQVSENATEQVAHQLYNFTAERLLIELRSQGFRYDVLECSLRSSDLPAKPPHRTVDRLEQDFVRLLRRAEAIQSFVTSDDGANLLVAYRRASNIVLIEERKGGWEPGAVDPNLFRQLEERAVVEHLAQASMAADKAIDREDFAAAMAALATLRQPVDAFFDKVTVNTDEKVIVNGKEHNLRENRLRLLSRIRTVMNQVADFSQIEGS